GGSDGDPVREVGQAIRFRVFSRVVTSRFPREWIPPAPSASRFRRLPLRGRVGLLLDELGTEQLIDPALEGGTTIAGAIGRAHQRDDPGPEVLVPTAPADPLLALPERLVDRPQLGR